MKVPLGDPRREWLKGHDGFGPPMPVSEQLSKNPGREFRAVKPYFVYVEGFHSEPGKFDQYDWPWRRHAVKLEKKALDNPGVITLEYLYWLSLHNWRGWDGNVLARLAKRKGEPNVVTTGEVVHLVSRYPNVMRDWHNHIIYDDEVVNDLRPYLKAVREVCEPWSALSWVISFTLDPQPDNPNSIPTFTKLITEFNELGIGFDTFISYRNSGFSIEHTKSLVANGIDKELAHAVILP